MQKIRISVLNKMIEKQLTNAEIDFIIYTSRYQNDYGCVDGVYYKEICIELGISYQKFYDIKKSLLEKKIISAVKGSYTDWNIKIEGNDCSDLESFKNDGYINTNHNIFYDKNFFALKAGEKLLAMHLIKIAAAGRGSYNIGVNNFFEKYTSMFKVTKRVLQNYLSSLKAFFSIGIKEKQYWIRPLANVFRMPGVNRSEADNYNKHVGQTICRREKVKFSDESLKDTVDLLKQYRNILLDKAEEILQKAVKLSVAKANNNIKNPRNWTRLLQPKLVHKVLIEDLIPLGV